MHVGVTELLTCPACRSGAGLVLLADEVGEGRVLAGTLGCPHCRTRFAVEHGIARLDRPVQPADASSSDAEQAGALPRDTQPAGAWSGDADRGAPDAGAAASDEPMHWAAMLGLADAQGQVLLVGDAAALAGGVAALVPDVEVIAATRAESPAAAPRTSRIRFGDVLPILHGRLRVVGVAGPMVDPLLDAAAGVLATGGRLVLRPPPAGGAARLEAAGLRVVARTEDTVVAHKT